MEKPILFSTPMVQAIMEGRKTQTRRIVKDSMLQENNGKYDEEFLFLTVKKCPYGEVGDVLWVRETWFSTKSNTKELLEAGDLSHIRYKAENNYDPNKDCVGRKWKPSIHMPKAACRIFLEITNIRIERLNNISEDDAIAEGVNRTDAMNEWYYMENVYNTDSPLIAFESLWESINGRESWDSNPYVWVIEFKQIVKTQTNE